MHVPFGCFCIFIAEAAEAAPHARRAPLDCLHAMASRFLSRSDSCGSKASADEADVGAAGSEALTLVAERAEAVRAVLETVMRPPAAKKYPNNIREWLVRTSPGQKRTGAQLQTPPKAKPPGKHGRAAAAAASSHPEKEQQSEDTSTKQKTQKQLAVAKKKLSNRTGTVDDGPESKVDAEEELATRKSQQREARKRGGGKGGRRGRDTRRR